MSADDEDKPADLVGAGCMGAVLGLLPIMFLAMAGSDLIHPALQGGTLKVVCLLLWLAISGGVYLVRNVRPGPRFGRIVRGVVLVVMGVVGSVLLRQFLNQGEFHGPSKLFYLMWISPFLLLYGLGQIVSSLERN